MPWTWSLNWGVITPELIVGSCPLEPADLGEIKDSTGVTAILSLQHDECLAHYGIDYDRMRREGERLGLEMERCPILDFNPVETRKHLPEAVRRLAGLQSRGHRTYVHCTAGVSRAPLAVFGYLALVSGLDEATARRMIMEGRPESTPYWEAYQGARADLVAKHREAIEQHAHQLGKLGLSEDRAGAVRRAEVDVIRRMLAAP